MWVPGCPGIRPGLRVDDVIHSVACLVAPTLMSSSSPTTFEFTKRKRWADLLIHELSEAIIFVLSPAAKVWFCGRAVAELLGWSDAELIDHPFTDLVNCKPSLSTPLSPSFTSAVLQRKTNAPSSSPLMSLSAPARK